MSKWRWKDSAVLLTGVHHAANTTFKEETSACNAEGHYHHCKRAHCGSLVSCQCCQVCSSFHAALGFVTQQKTAVGQHLLKDLCERVTQYVKSCNTKRERHHIVMHCIGNMDETATWADMPANDCQKQYICAITNNQARYAAHYHLTDGTKLSPFVVFKGKSIAERRSQHNQCHVHISKNAWMSEDLTIK